MEAFLEVFTIIIGRLIFGTIGSLIRKCWVRILRKISSKENQISISEFDHVIDVESFKNRIVGFFFILFTSIFLFVILN